MDEYNQTFVISEAAHWDSQQQFKKTKPIAIKETDIGEGWVRVELAWAVRVWLEGRERLHTLHVACRTCQVCTPRVSIEVAKLRVVSPDTKIKIWQNVIQNVEIVAVIFAWWSQPILAQRVISIYWLEIFFP